MHITVLSSGLRNKRKKSYLMMSKFMLKTFFKINYIHLIKLSVESPLGHCTFALLEWR